MKALWGDAGNDLDWVKADAHDMTALYLPISDPPADVKRRLTEIRSHGYVAGVYMAWNWPMFAGMSGTSVAELMHSLVATVSPSAPVKVQFDIEAHDPEFILETLTRWRAIRPKQDTSWTLESFQGGWMSPEFVAAIVALKVRVVPQFYSGVMGDVDDPKALLAEQVAQDMALRDLTRRGFPEALVTGFYDAATLPDRWDGWAFTQGRLP